MAYCSDALLVTTLACSLTAFEGLFDFHGIALEKLEIVDAACEAGESALAALEE